MPLHCCKLLNLAISSFRFNKMLRIAIVICLVSSGIRAQTPTNALTSTSSESTAKCKIDDVEINFRIGKDSTVDGPCSMSQESSCGYRKEGTVFTYRISGVDVTTQINEFPWVVAIWEEVLLLGILTKVYKCVGSLIHPSVVLTAAHCISNTEPSKIKIRAGESNIENSIGNDVGQYRQVVNYVIHENYQNRTGLNDIALLLLDKPVDITKAVSTICLPPQNQNFDLQRCLVSGWGKDAFGKLGKHQTTLKTIELPIVPRSECLTALRTTRLGSSYELHDSFICAGGERGMDTCEGDGGAALVCPIPNSINRYYQVGIVSWGIGCGDAIPGIYVNVPLFRNWIVAKLQDISTENTYYMPR